MISQCTTAWHSSNLALCESLGLDISTWASIIGLIVLAITYLLKLPQKLWGCWKKYRVSKSTPAQNFQQFCKNVRPLVKDNSRLFHNFGPNSGADGEPNKVVRQNQQLWYDVRAKIDQNNAQIKTMILDQIEAIPDEHKPLFNDWLSHIDAFNAHITDPEVNYQEHQFPTSILEIINEN